MRNLSPLADRPAGTEAGYHDRLPAACLLGIARSLAPEAFRLRTTLSESRRSWSLLCATPLYEAWVISWPSGGSIDLHDHGRSSAAIQVVSGTLEETRVIRSRHDFCSIRTAYLGPGGSSEIPDGCIHDIVNTTEAPATSVHVYSPRLRSMTYYGFGDGALERKETVHYDG